MNIGQVCNRSVATIERTKPVLEAARRMRDEHVGALVVVDERAGGRRPVGLITDRDIVVGLLATDVAHIRKLDVGEVLSREVVTIGENGDVRDALALMRRHGIRRMPVVDAHGALVGIFTVDDLLALVADDLSAAIALIRREQRHEIERRP